MVEGCSRISPALGKKASFVASAWAAPRCNTWRACADAVGFFPKRFHASNIARRDRRVVFVSDVPTQREAKLAFGLKRAGWDVIQLYREKTALADFSSVAEARPFQSRWQAVELAHHAEGRLFHHFSYAGDQTSAALLSCKPGRVIFDFYDYFFSMVDGFPDREKANHAEVAHQAWCIEAADALCCRDMQLQYRRHNTRAGRGKPLLLFPEYCWNNTPLLPRRNDGEVHIVQIGTMGLEEKGQEDIGAFRILALMVESGCHLHIYLHPLFPKIGTPAFDRDFANYLDLAARTGRIHIYPTISPAQIVQEIGRYDLGAGVTNAMSFDIPWHHHNPGRFPLCGSSRMFDYLDAGLGLLIHKQLHFMFRTFGRFGVAFDATSMLDSGVFEAMRNRPDNRVVTQARQMLAVENNIGRLVQFYEKLA